MKTLNDLNKSELEKLISIIGNGVRPIKAGKLLFPDYKNKTRYAKDVRNFCWNKLTALNMALHFSTRQDYLMISNRIHFDLPGAIQRMDFEPFVKGGIKC